MTGRPGCRTMEMNGGSSAVYLARTPCVPLFCTLFNTGGNRRASRLPGEGGDHFHCTVEPSPVIFGVDYQEAAQYLPKGCSRKCPLHFFILRGLFLEHFCLDQFSVIQGKFYMQRFSNTSFGRTLLGSNFRGLLLEQTFCLHFAAFPP